ESRRLLGVLETRLAGRPWIMGDDYTIADISHLGWVRNLVGFYGAGDLVRYGELTRVPAWLERCLARAAVQRRLEIPKRGCGRSANREHDGMTGGPSLIATIAMSLATAYVGGMLARLVRLPPLVGYLIAGIAVGPFTPGMVADQATVEQLAEIGVALLLFGVGLHFSIDDLVAVWRIAVPGALLQVVLSAAIGFGVGRAIGFDAQASAVL